MNIRLYKPEDCQQMIQLFYETVHTVNARDYNQSQLDVWAPREIDASAWDQSFSKDYTIVVENDELEKYAQENNIKSITVEASITAKPFFEKRGYHVVKHQQVGIC